MPCLRKELEYRQEDSRRVWIDRVREIRIELTTNPLRLIVIIKIDISIEQKGEEEEGDRELNYLGRPPYRVSYYSIRKFQPV